MSQDGLSKKEKLDHYSKEIALIMKRVEWDYDMIEKQRNYAFLFIGLIIGAKSSSILSPGALALVSSSVLIIMATRIIGQLDFLSVILDRQLEIETNIEKIGFSEHYAIQHTYASHFGSGLNFFVSYLLLITFLLSGASYMAVVSYMEVESGVVKNAHAFLYFTGLSILIYRVIAISIIRIKNKKKATTSRYGAIKISQER